jgi:hypothetical protein
MITKMPEVRLRFNTKEINPAATETVSTKENNISTNAKTPE